MVTIDLRQDADAVRAMLAEAVREYIAKHREPTSAALHPPVTRIDVGYSLGDSESIPWIHLHFDTKPGAEPDGDPTHHGFAQLDRESWLPAVQAVCEEEKVSVVRWDGKRQQCDAASLGEVIGQFLVSLLLEARDSGLFATLPRAERCELGVEDPTTGEFGWPHYEERGQENLV